jgi:hypothetical protein
MKPPLPPDDGTLSTRSDGFLIPDRMNPDNIVVEVLPPTSRSAVRLVVREFDIEAVRRRMLARMHAAGISDV